jgi:hypothetical protein
VPWLERKRKRKKENQFLNIDRRTVKIIIINSEKKKKNKKCFQFLIMAGFDILFVCSLQIWAQMIRDPVNDQSWKHSVD